MNKTVFMKEVDTSDSLNKEIKCSLFIKRILFFDHYE